MNIEILKQFWKHRAYFATEMIAIAFADMLWEWGVAHTVHATKGGVAVLWD